MNEQLKVDREQWIINDNKQENNNTNNKENNSNKPSRAERVEAKIDSIQGSLKNLDNSSNSTRKQLDNIQDAVNKILNIIENKDATCTTTSTKLDNYVSTEDIIRLKDSGKTYKQIDELFGYKDGWSRKRIQRYNEEHDTDKLYANFAKKILNSKKVASLHKEQLDMICEMLGTTVKEWEALRDGLHKADDDTTKTSKQ